jgi:hypothetical protein
MFLNYFALGVLIFVFLVLFYGSSPFMIFLIIWPKNATTPMPMQSIRPGG